jgi:hypothetical protein
MATDMQLTAYAALPLSRRLRFVPRSMEITRTDTGTGAIGLREQQYPSYIPFVAGEEDENYHT